MPGTERADQAVDSGATSENQLPGQVPSTAVPKDQGEDRLPGDKREASAEEDRTSAALPGQIQPLLRLDFEGHTGVIRTLDIGDRGQTLVTGGEDKDLHVWRRTELGETGWLHRRTIRWPITRGPRGRIYATSLRGDLVAFAGHGAFGTAGEIRVVDAASGELKQTLVGDHRKVITSLAWAPGELLRLVSVDMEGLLTRWQPDPATGIWVAKTLVPNDTTKYGPQWAEFIRSRRGFVPLTFSGPDHVVVAQFAGLVTEPQMEAKWHLARIDLDLREGASQLLTDLDHLSAVLDCASTPDGRVLASCDGVGSIGLWSIDGNKVTKARQFQPPEPPLFIDLDASGKRLLVGTRQTDATPTAKLQLWDLQVDPPALISEKSLSTNPLAGVLDSDHRQAIVSQSSRIEIHSFDDSGAFSEADPQELTIPAKPVLRVAFSRENDPFRIAFSSDRGAAGQERFDGVFDLTASKLLGRSPIDPDDFLPAQRTATKWDFQQVVLGPDESAAVGAGKPRGEYQLREGDQPRGDLPFQYDRHGAPSAICTLPKPSTGSEEPDEQPATGAVIVGTSGRNDIYVYSADDSNPPKLMRHFRGHSGTVESLSTSADGRYLVSGGEDSTIAIWNLQDLYSASPSVNLWGVEFEVDNDRLVAAEVREDGPLYFRGVRDGDRLVSIQWADQTGNVSAESNADKMFDHLLTAPFDQMVTFQFSRFGRARPLFQSYPAWRPLATLFVDQTREWAFWTPAGYYDASFNGHHRFGWQINKGIDQTPDYFQAAQFRQSLERPEILRRLLATGSLPAAMRQSLSGIGPPQGEGAIVNQYLNQPKIELTQIVGLTGGQETVLFQLADGEQPKGNQQPDSEANTGGGLIFAGDRLRVTARITVPLGATLIDPRAFVSGVPAVSRTKLPDEEGSGGVQNYRWEFRLPRDQHLQLEILAATEAEALDRVIVELEHPIGHPPQHKPRLHVLAIGAGNYPDPQIQSLDFAADAARKVSQLFRDKSASIYQTTADELVDQDATRPLWRVFAQQAAQQLSETVSPDDLVIMYLCGHGLRDRQTNQWYFVTADARYSDLMSEQYADCLSFSDLASLAKLPCRKLAILDSCHSGAVQPLMQRDDLKSALRFLQDDVVLTLTASEGDEEAAEQRETQMGRFTTKLVQGLQGSADENHDNLVTLDELVAYVTRTVADESEQEGMPQHPTASPHYLLRTLRLPLTAVPGN